MPIPDAVTHGVALGSVGLTRPCEVKHFPAISIHKLLLNLPCSFIERSISAKTLIIGIQPRELGLGEGLSDEVASATEGIVELLAELSSELEFGG